MVKDKKPLMFERGNSFFRIRPNFGFMLPLPWPRWCVHYCGKHGLMARKRDPEGRINYGSVRQTNR